MADDSKYKIKFTADLKEVMAAIKKVQAEQKRSMALSRQAQKFQKGVDKGQIGEHKALVKTNALRLKGISDEKRAENARMGVAKQSLRDLRNLDRIKSNSLKASGGKKGGGVGGLTWGKAGLMGAAGGIAASIGSAVIDFVRGGIESTYGKYQQFAVARGQNIGLGTPEEINAGIDAGRTSGKKLGFGATEVAGMQGAMGRATGSLDPTLMMQMMRASGMTSGQTAGLFGTMRQGGTKFGAGGMANKELSKVLALGQSTGLEKARVPEYLEGIQNLMQQEMANSAKEVKAGGMAQLMSQLMKSSGLAPSRAAGILGQVSNMFTNPGGGETGMAFMQRVAGFGLPGGTNDYYEAEKQREEALNDPKNFLRMMKRLSDEGKGGREGAFALRRLGGFPLKTGETIQKLAEDAERGSYDEEAVKKIMEGAKPIDQQALIYSKEISDSLKQIAKLEDLAIKQGESVAGNVNSIESALVDLRDASIEHFGKPVLDFITGDDKSRKKAVQMDYLLSKPPESTPEGINNRKNLIKERLELEKNRKEGLWGYDPKRKEAKLNELNEELRRVSNNPSGKIFGDVVGGIPNLTAAAIAEATAKGVESGMARAAENKNNPMVIQLVAPVVGNVTETKVSVPSTGNRR